MHPQSERGEGNVSHQMAAQRQASATAGQDCLDQCLLHSHRRLFLSPPRSETQLSNCRPILEQHFVSSLTAICSRTVADASASHLQRCTSVLVSQVGGVCGGVYVTLYRGDALMLITVGRPAGHVWLLICIASFLRAVCAREKVTGEVQEDARRARDPPTPIT